MRFNLKNCIKILTVTLIIFTSTWAFSAPLSDVEAAQYVGYFTADQSQSRTVDETNSAKYQVRSLDGKGIQLRIREQRQLNNFFQATANKGEKYALDTGWLNTAMHLQDPSMISSEYKRLRNEKRDWPSTFSQTKNDLLQALAKKQVGHVLFITTKSSQKAEALKGNPDILEVGPDSCSIFYTLAIYLDKKGNPLFINFHVIRDYGHEVYQSVLMHY